jgi:hypothetical protein
LNCSQARGLLAIYRETKEKPQDSTALADHLASCEACSAVSTQYDLVGEHIRSMPTIEPSPDAHARLMQALVVEHVRFLRRTPSSAESQPTPTFLVPYLQDVAHKSAPSETLRAFSSANTGPLPVIRPTRSRSSYRMSHIAILGLAASFLIVLMTGGLTALLLIARQGPSNSITITSNTSIHQSSQVDTVPHATLAAYPHVASAVANEDSIYYTAYNDGATNWMLEKLDNSNNQTSTPLLSSPATHPLLVLGGTKDWLVWLQMDAPAQGKGKASSPLVENKLEGSWSLHALPLSSNLSTAKHEDVKSLLLHKDSFESAHIPSWVNAPVQGLWFMQNRVLVTFIDSQGTSHLVSYQLDIDKVSATKELAHTNKGHILTSPTATSDGAVIYWSEEWMSNTSSLVGKIWTQQIVDATPDLGGRWAPHTKTETYLFRPDENLFHPQIVNNTLFLLNNAAGVTGSAQNGAQQAQNVQPTSIATSKVETKSGAAAQPVATPAPLNIAIVLGGATRIDPTIRVPQIDEALAGKLLAFTADGSLPQSTPTEDNKLVSALQGGSRFLIWQNAARGFEMYDVATRSQVSIDPADIPKDAAFMAVNGDTAVWAVYTKPASPADKVQDNTDSKVTFGTFRWPSRQKGAANS